MFDIHAMYATDESAENKGVWVPLGNAEFLIARAGNQAYSKLLASLYEQHKLTLERGGAEADKLSDELMVQVLATTVLLGWKGPVGYKGAAMDYSVENAKTLLSIKDFRRVITEKSADLALFRYKETEAQTGN